MDDRPTSAVKDRLPAAPSLAPTDGFIPRHLGSDEAEVARNPRSRSAVMRVAERLAA